MLFSTIRPILNKNRVAITNLIKRYSSVIDTPSTEQTYYYGVQRVTPEEKTEKGNYILISKKLHPLFITYF